jgi:hypothetical protein
MFIQNTVENNHSEAVTENSDMFQAEVSSEAESRTDRLLTNITNVCRQDLESRINLTSTSSNRVLQIYNELR